MTYVPFEGEKSVKTVRLKKDGEFFKKAVKKMGFKKDIDLVTFCVAIAIRKEYEDKTLAKKPLTSSQKLVGMESFDKKDFYDLIILEYLNFRKERLKEFETYFYTGFTVLHEWFEENDAEASSEIERFSGIWDYITRDNDQNE